jgi:hypothetical protein
MSEHRLSEIVIERPRHGMRISLKKTTGSKKQLDKLTEEATQDGLLNSYLIKPRRKSKGLSDHLAPLRRLLRSQVGQPWNEVYSQLCRRLNHNTMAGQHVLDHVDQYVEKHVELIDGIPYRKTRSRYSQSLLNRYWDQFYVHPDTGLLCLVDPLLRRQTLKQSKASAQDSDIVILDHYSQYHRIHQIWYFITFVEFASTLPVYDVLLGMINRDQAIQLRGRPIYAVQKRQCHKREIQSIPQITRSGERTG